MLSYARKHIFKQDALFTIRIGDLLYKDESLDKKAQEEELTIRAHEAVCKLAGIEKADNLYPPIFNNNKRIYFEEENKK